MVRLPYFVYKTSKNKTSLEHGKTPIFLTAFVLSAIGLPTVCNKTAKVACHPSIINTPESVLVNLA